jgi:hypothetical protein
MPLLISEPSGCDTSTHKEIVGTTVGRTSQTKAGSEHGAPDAFYELHLDQDAIVTVSACTNDTDYPVVIGIVSDQSRNESKALGLWVFAANIFLSFPKLNVDALLSAEVLML